MKGAVKYKEFPYPEIFVFFRQTKLGNIFDGKATLTKIYMKRIISVEMNFHNVDQLFTDYYNNDRFEVQATV